MKEWFGPIAVLYPAEQETQSILRQPPEARETTADIAYALKECRVPIITPVAEPDPHDAYQWSFPDTNDGINQALSQGARILWPYVPMDTEHPLSSRLEEGMGITGQMPVLIDPLESKAFSHNVIQHGGIVMPLATSADAKDIISQFDIYSAPYGMDFPLIVKPVRGYGRRNVRLVHNREELMDIVEHWDRASAGDEVMIQAFLPGEEITIVVFPPGDYQIDETEIHKTRYWALPPVHRIHHVDQILPPDVPLLETVEPFEPTDEVTVREAAAQAMKLADLVQSRSVITVDFRQDASGQFRIFDANFVPDLAGGNRPGREQAQSLVAYAAQVFGWEYPELIENLARQWWTFEE